MDGLFDLVIIIAIIMSLLIAGAVKKRIENRRLRARKIWYHWVLAHNTNTFICRVDSVKQNKNKITADVSECRYLGSLLKRYEVGIKSICWDETMNRIDIFYKKKAKIKKGEYLVISGNFFERYMEQSENYYYNSMFHIDDYRYVMEILPKDTEFIADNVEKEIKKIERLFGPNVAKTLRLITRFDNEEQCKAFCRVEGILKKRHNEPQKRGYFDELEKLRDSALV
jgi:hypothetical protein